MRVVGTYLEEKAGDCFEMLNTTWIVGITIAVLLFFLNLGLILWYRKRLEDWALAMYWVLLGLGFSPIIGIILLLSGVGRKKTN